MYDKINSATTINNSQIKRSLLLEQVIYKTILCVLSAIACIFTIVPLSVGYQESIELNSSFYVYYTNISNYIVFVVNLIVLRSIIKKIKKGEIYGHNTIFPKLKYCTTIMIFITFVIYAVVLPDETTYRAAPLILTHGYWLDLKNLLLHFICPLLFVADWFLYEKHLSVKISHVFFSMLIPLIYATFIMIRGAILTVVYKGMVPNEIIHYPYFFLNSYKYGYTYVFCWCLVLTGIFLILGFVLWAMDKIIKIDGKYHFIVKNDFSRENLNSIN